MNKTRLFMLLGVVLLSLALVGMALAADNALEPPPPDDISASTVNYIDPATFSPTGGTVDLCFNVTVSSPDLEYLDGFDFDLPDDWTVNSVTDVPGTGCGDGHTYGVLAGNFVYWYTNGMPSQCGDWSNGTYDFCANVTVPAGCTASWDLPWNIYGDTYGSPPHSVSGSASASCEVSADPAIQVNAPPLHAIQPPNTFTTIPIEICNVGGGVLSWAISEVPPVLGGSMPFVPVSVEPAQVAPDGLTVSSSSTQIGTPTGSAHPDAVLWDQPLSTVNQNAYVNQDFPDYPTSSAFLADDFTNAEDWAIYTIFVPGDGWNGFSTLMNATALTWQIYADNAGVPAGDPSGGGAPPLWTLTLPPTDPQVVLTTGTPGGYLSNTQLNLTTPVILPPGHYWIIFYPTMNFTSYGQFGRQPADTTNGYTGQFINPGGGFGYGTVWQPWTVLGVTQTDIAFRLEGIPNVDIPWLSESPITGTIPGGGCQPVDVNFDSTGMAAGDYFGGLQIDSNDPVNPSVNLPVNLTVTGPQAEGLLYMTSLDLSDAVFAVYDPASDSWTGLTPYETGCQMAVSNSGQLYAYGFNTGTIDLYDPATDTWSPVMVAPPGTNSYYCNLEITNAGEFLYTQATSNVLWYTSGGVWNSLNLPFTTDAMGDYDSTTDQYVIGEYQTTNAHWIDVHTWTITDYFSTVQNGEWARFSVVMGNRYYFEAGGSNLFDFDLSNNALPPFDHGFTPGWFTSAAADRPNAKIFNASIDGTVLNLIDPATNTVTPLTGYTTSIWHSSLAFTGTGGPVDRPIFDQSYKLAPAQVFSGDPIHYTVVISNTGTVPGLATTMVDLVPPGTTYVDNSVTCNSGTCWFDPGTNTVNWAGQVAPGGGPSSAACSLPGNSSADIVRTPVVGGTPAMGTLDQGTPKLPDTETQGPAPEALWPGPDGYGYAGSSVAFNWVDISGSGTPITGLSDDNSVGPFPIGFTFGFYGTPWADFYAGSNGFISFGAGSSSLSNQCPLPDVNLPDNLIAMMWDDLNFSTSGSAYYQTFNPCPIGAGACLVVEYANVAHYGGAAGSAGTWELLLYDSGAITLQYLDVGVEAGSGSTEGIEDANFAADYGLTYACEAATLTNNTAVSFGLPTGIFIMPDSVDAQGCGGIPQDHAFNVFNYAGYDTTINLTYTILAGSGTCTGPASVGVPNGGSAPFVATITPTGNPGDLVVCQIYGVDAQNPDNNDTSLINKTIVSGITGWQQIPDEPNLGRMDNVTSGYNGFAWSITGYGGDANVRYYDPAVNAWTVVANSAMPFGSNYTRSGCTAGDTVFMYGDASTVGYTGLWSYNMATNVWAQVTPSGTPPAQTGIWAPAWVYDLASGYCFMTGGASTPGGGNLTTTYVYDPMSNTWLNPLPNFTTNRAFHAAFIYDRPADSHHLLCVAGGVDANSVVYTSTQCFDFMTGVWNAENVDMGSMPSTGHGLWGVGYADKWHMDNEHQLWIVDGADSAFAIANMTYYFDVNTGTWVDGDPLPSGGVYRTSAVTVNNDIFHLGGSTGGFSYTGLADHHLQLVCPPTMTNPVVVEFDAIANACPATVDNMAVINDPAIPAPVEVTASTDVVCSQTFTMEKLAPATAFTGDVIPYTINIDFSELVGTAVLTDVIPAGVQFADNLTATAGTAMYDPGTNAVYWTYDMNPPLAQPDAVLWDNGPLVTHPGGGYGGADASALQSALGLTIYGFGHQYLSNNHMADDFVIADPGGWNINQITFFAYQTGAPTSPSPLTAVYYQIWNGPPDNPSSSIVFGDLVTNRLVNSTFSNIYRALDTDLLNNQRAIFVDTVNAGVTLPPGTYWIEWTTDGSGAYSGPWAPPISILGQTSTGNAKQNLAGTWAEALDGTSPQGMPFIIEGTGGGPNPTHVTISFDVLVTSQGNPNPVVNTANLSWMGMYGSASASTAILTPSITLAKTVGTQAGVCATTDAITVPPGTTVYYCYTATNSGNVALNTHDLYDTVLGQLFTGNSIPLDPGASYSYIAAPYVANATVTNTGTWTAWADETHSTEASDTATVTVYAPQSDLAVIKSGEPDSVRVGETITYTLVVTNYGPDAATGVMLEDTLPVSVTFESASPGCTNLSGVVTCDIGDLAVDESVTRYIVVTANAVGIATNTAEVWSDNTDPDPDNNIATEDTLINPAMYNFYLPIINKH